MDDTELRELEDRETWDDDVGEVRPPVKAPRAVVSVAFARDDFERVSEFARRAGMKTSEFIRRSALEAVGSQVSGVTITSITGSIHTDYVQVRPRAARTTSTMEETLVYATP